MKLVYEEDFDVKKLSPKERAAFKKHKIASTFPVAVLIILHLITVGLFTLIYFGMKHGRLPKIYQNDPSTARAIGFMFIPFFNIYWFFFYWLRLIERINLQFKLRNQEPPLDKTLALVALILGLIPYLGMISGFILMPIVAGLIQHETNELVRSS